MNETALLTKLDCFQPLMKLNKEMIPPELRYDSDDIYYFPQKTEEIFDTLVEYTVRYHKNGQKEYGTKFYIKNYTLSSLFEKITNPMVHFDVYDLLTTRWREEDTTTIMYLISWDIEDGNKVFYFEYCYSCEYHNRGFKYLWVEQKENVNDFLEIVQNNMSSIKECIEDAILDHIKKIKLQQNA